VEVRIEMMGDEPHERWLFHLALAGEWQQALLVGTYEQSTLNRSLADEGFIHCSFASQVQSIADLVYAGRNDVVLLRIDPARLNAMTRVENLDGGTVLFPHIYGPLLVSAVVQVDEVAIDGNGRLRVDDLVSEP
jgi:uncharacterized protein (DUF952 family)